MAKPAGRACPNLAGDFGCTIHAELRERGFAGCTAYDCFGAGQLVTALAPAGQHWRGRPELAELLFAAFATARQLHELLWYLDEALELAEARALRSQLEPARAETARLAGLGREALADLDLSAHGQLVGALLRRASELTRAGLGPGENLARADLSGRGLRGADLRAADLRGACLIGVDLRAADLRGADLIGADLRGADLRGADLSGALFLTRPQLGGLAATGPPACRGASSARGTGARQARSAAGQRAAGASGASAAGRTRAGPRAGRSGAGAPGSAAPGVAQPERVAQLAERVGVQRDGEQRVFRRVALRQAEVAANVREVRWAVRRQVVEQRAGGKWSGPAGGRRRGGS